ncbi:nuclear transport factor 2 family protein [Paucibacter soli]|uniref:nuclear transport factor 2 family protein n=1 Tax=Paucibacter soli TaxID=3133433 RepID=UPI0030970847
MSGRSDDDEQIRALLRLYLDGLYHCDTQRLAQVFHPQALYATAAGEHQPPLLLNMQEYFPIVQQRDPPARSGAPRREAILCIDVAGPATAMVKLSCSFFQKDYVDFLTLIHVEGRWQIIAKVFHFEPQSASG